MASSMRLSDFLFSTARSPGAVSQFRSQSKRSPVLSSQCRLFSKSLERRSRGVSQNVPVRTPAQPSIRTRTREISRADLPQDIGLLPGTFIRPLWRDMPSIFEQPRERLQMEWLWLKSAFQNFVGLLAYSKWINKGLPLRLKERRQVARELHKAMYSAFAAGDADTLRKICCTGLANDFGSRITKRARDERVSWKLEKYLRTPATFFTGIRVVSDRATQIPELPNSGVRQVIVRITSRQSTGRSKRGVRPASDNRDVEKVKQQDCTEYIVLQKLRWTGEDDDWRIWGHAAPTTVDDLDSPFFASGLTLSERLAAMRETMQGNRRP